VEANLVPPETTINLELVQTSESRLTTKQQSEELDRIFSCWEEAYTETGSPRKIKNRINELRVNGTGQDELLEEISGFIVLSSQNAELDRPLDCYLYSQVEVMRRIEEIDVRKSASDIEDDILDIIDESTARFTEPESTKPAPPPR
jgi:hypothetical protein